MKRTFITAGIVLTALSGAARQPERDYRFNWGCKVGINVGIGYTLDGYRYEKYIESQTPEGHSIYVPTGEYSNWSQSAFSFRVGVDF